MTIRAQASKLYYGIKREAAKIRYTQSLPSPNYLPKELLYELDPLYSHEDRVLYDFDSIYSRAQERFRFISEKLSVYGRSIKGLKSLELGCGDGLICAFINEHGGTSAAIDTNNSLFDPYATDRGVEYHTMNAGHLDFEDATFDFIFSYNGFEHFSDPGKVFSECKRVLKPGGIMFFQFYPLYYSPFGYHAYKSIGIPYLHILFSQKDFTAFAEANQRTPIVNDPSFLNRKPVEFFRDLFLHQRGSEFRMLYYEEQKNNYFVDLIRKYPGCFRKENVSFDNFIVGGMQVWMQRTV